MVINGDEGIFYATTSDRIARINGYSLPWTQDAITHGFGNRCPAHTEEGRGRDRPTPQDFAFAGPAASLPFVDLVATASHAEVSCKTFSEVLAWKHVKRLG